MSVDNIHLCMHCKQLIHMQIIFTLRVIIGFQTLPLFCLINPQLLVLHSTQAGTSSEQGQAALCCYRKVSIGYNVEQGGGFQEV
jgi:hypothetical protein